jgi:hypothetical protein
MGYRRWREFGAGQEGDENLQHRLFYPMLAMFLWTVVVMLRNLKSESRPSSEENSPTNILNCLEELSHPKPFKNRQSFPQFDRVAAALL